MGSASLECCHNGRRLPIPFLFLFPPFLPPRLGLVAGVAFNGIERYGLGVRLETPSHWCF